MSTIYYRVNGTVTQTKDRSVGIDRVSHVHIKKVHRCKPSVLAIGAFLTPFIAVAIGAFVMAYTLTGALGIQILASASVVLASYLVSKWEV